MSMQTRNFRGQRKRISRSFGGGRLTPLHDRPGHRPLRLEALEQRTLLSVSAAEADYLIIVADGLEDEIQPLAEWKHVKGFKTHVATMQDVELTQGGRTSADVYDFIYDAYRAGPPTSYLLLVGDHDMVPSNDHGTYLSDYDYACLEGSDDFAEVALGRISVRTELETENVVAKILKYECDPDLGDWYNDALIAGQFQDNGDGANPPIRDGVADRWFMETLMYQHEFLENHESLQMQMHTALYPDTDVRETYYYREDSSSYPHRITVSGDPPYEVPQDVVDLWVNPATEELWTQEELTPRVRDAFNGGLGLSQYTDHGASGGWWAVQFGTEDIAQLSNGMMTPVVFSSACSTGDFDRTVQEEEDDCFAEALLKLPIESSGGSPSGGAVGVVAASGIAFSGTSDAFFNGIYTCLWPDYDPIRDPLVENNPYPYSMRPAEAMNFGRYYLAHYRGSTHSTFWLYHWFGDPEMMLRTETPFDLAVKWLDGETESDLSTLTTTVGSPTDLTLVVRDDAQQPVADALVCISRENFGDHWVGATDASGQVTFADLTTHEVADGQGGTGYYDVTVTAHNAVPQQETFRSLANPQVLIIDADYLDPVPSRRNDGSADTFFLRRDPVLDELEILVGGLAAPNVPYSSFEMIYVNGSSDDAHLTVNLSGGDPAPAGGLHFFADGTDDWLNVEEAVDASFDLVTYEVTGCADGVLSVDSSIVEGAAVTFCNVETVHAGEAAQNNTVDALHVDVTSDLGHRVDVRTLEFDTTELVLPSPLAGADPVIIDVANGGDDVVSVECTFHPDVQIVGDVALDEAELIGSDQDGDVLDASPGSASLTNTFYALLAQGFQTVVVDGRAGVDQLTLGGGAGADQLTASPTAARLEEPGVYRIDTENFEQITVNGQTGDGDNALLSGSVEDDLFTFTAATDEAQLVSGDLATMTLHGFEAIEVTSGSSGEDVANMYGSAGDDYLHVKSPSSATLTIDGAQTIKANSFDRVYVEAGEGGTDEASLDGIRDLLADEVLVAFPLYCSLSDHEDLGQAEYLYQAANFPSVSANGALSVHDRAYVYGSSGNDHVAATGNSVTRSMGTEWSNTVHAFKNVYLYDSEGTDTTSIAWGELGSETELFFDVLYWDEQGAGNWDDSAGGWSRWVDWGNNTVPDDKYPNGEFTTAVVRSDEVTVASDCSVPALRVESGQVVVASAPTAPLTIDHTLTLCAAPGEQLTFEGGAALHGDLRYVPEWKQGDANSGLLHAAASLELAGTLWPRAVAHLAENVCTPSATGVDGWGGYTRTIITGAEDLSGESFDVIPPVHHVDGHLGCGVFMTDLFNFEEGNGQQGNGQAVTYTPTAVHVDLFQAAAGDCDGDREVCSTDIEMILAANKFGKSEEELRAEGGWPALWTEGDFTADGLVGGADIEALLSTDLFGNGIYWPSGGGESAAGGGSEDLAGPGEMLPADEIARAVPTLVVTPDGLVIDTAGATINGYRITSSAGVFTGLPAQNLGAFREDRDDQISGSFAFTLVGTHRLGNVVGAEHVDVDLLSDLAFTYTLAGQPGLYRGSTMIGEVGSDVTELAGPAAAADFPLSADSLDWLYEFEEMMANQRSAATEDAVEQAVDLAILDGGS